MNDEIPRRGGIDRVNQDEGQIPPVVGHCV